ncbi:putative pathogenesis associated protein Cap20 [Talaromyces proteolyticus]|uniref:Pathogenesis associated protein Cap20 n=1 Tax=Talaromyces proteolyticus TaxID=1131652 RepID=A0AAD4KRI0_9EURO|nr:putative pathogenesis associated protein Cap20 [Talaromyces proteolyticus]KAH8695406.1 putative pathogenesis associated protein Cap20 [Talaromyces proteolyticus]
MPHAERDTMGEPTINGAQPHSQFISHLTSYPFVSDSITIIKSNKYGAKSLTYADQGYERFAKPYLPYLSTPYAYVAPYVAKADTLGDQGLSKVDERFPIVKEDTEKIKSTIIDTAYFPLRLADDARQHLFDTYGAEYKKCGGDGYVASGKAVITTGLVISQESLAWLSNTLAAKKEQAKETVNEKINH